MSNNPTTATTVPAEPVVPTITTPETPKVDGKFKTALKHPVATARRHKTTIAVTAGVALGSVATFLLTKKDEDVIEANDSADEDVDSDSDTV